MSVADYTGLITSEHANRPKFAAMVGLVAGCFVDAQTFLRSLPTEFDIDTARWTQLDALGVRLGLSRNLQATGPGLYTQAPTGVAPLSDGDYATLLRGKIGANNWDGTKASALTHVRNLFPGTGALVFYEDHQDMTITIAVAGAVLDAGMRQALACGYMQVRPEGVLADYAFTSVAGPIFGLDVENDYIAGLDVGAWYVGA